jgi:hypothetical protein
MSAQGDDDWSAEPEPADDERVLRRRPDTVQDGPGRLDYADVITMQDTAWWAALSDYDYAYGVLRALESASERGAPLHLARCVHHLHDLLSGLDPADRAWVVALVRRIQGLLARRATREGTAVTLAALLAYLADVGTDPRFAPPPALPLGLLHRMYPRGVSPAELQEGLDRHRYPRGKPLPVCPVCEPDQIDPRDALARAVAALSAAQRDVLTRLGQSLALDGDAPDLIAQLAWVTGAQPMPALYQDTLAGIRGDSDTLEHALKVAEQR